MKSILFTNSTNALLMSAAMLATTFVASQMPASAEDFAQKHPRRAEVLHRDANINKSLNRNYGHLGGHYGQLKAEDKGIHQQERADKNANGGYITKGQQHQLNKEENQLKHQERADKTN